MSAQTSAKKLNIRAGTLDNSAGTLVQWGQDGTGTIQTRQAGLNNQQGRIESNTSLSLDLAGALDNRDGLIRTTTSSQTLSVQSTSLQNAQGRIEHLGSAGADIRVSGVLHNQASGSTGAGGVIGAVQMLSLQAAAIQNQQGGRLLSGHDLVLDTPVLDNSGGQLHSQLDFVLNDPGLTVLNVQGSISAQRHVELSVQHLDNTDGRISTVAQGEGDVRLTLGGTLTNTRGRIGADRDVQIQAQQLGTAGEIIAGRDLSLSVLSDLTHHAKQDLGNNQSMYVLGANRDITLNIAGRFTQMAGAQISSPRDLSVTANSITNHGDLLAGNQARLVSQTELNNHGGIIGASVSVAATQRLNNEGASALIGASDQNGTLELLSPLLINRDPTTSTDTAPQTALIGRGQVVIAGGINAQGHYTQAQEIRNESALIEAGSTLDIHAQTLTNTRRELRTTATYDVYVGTSSGTAGSTNRADLNAPGGQYIEPPRGGRMNSDYLYTEYTGTTYRNQVVAVSPAAQIIAGGDFSPHVSLPDVN